MKISPEMRAAIDKAVAEGRVTKVPTGVSGIPQDTPHDWKAQRDTFFKNARRGKSPDPAVAARRARVRDLHGAGKTVREIVDALGIADQIVRLDHTTMGLKVNRAKPSSKSPGGKTATEKREERHTRAAAKLRDRRRFKTTPVPMGKVSKLAPADATGTIFPTRVFDPSDEAVLVDGCSNAKIGGDVLKGRLKGARILTLTLEERATCPRSCAMWQGCYGNGMPHPRRWRHGPDLERKIRTEIEAACAANAQVLVRLHVLGDFYSMDYLALWVGLVDDFDNLNLFGFTAWGPDTEIGAGIKRVRDVYGTRFAIRHSGIAGRWGSFTIDGATEKRRLGDAIICPEQIEAMSGRQGRHCGNCALCWHSDACIVFHEH